MWMHVVGGWMGKEDIGRCSEDVTDDWEVVATLCTALSLGYGEWCVVMAWMLTFKAYRSMGGLELLAEECHLKVS